MASNLESLSLMQRVQLVWGLLRDDRVSPWVKKLGPAAIVAYVISPIDVIPDFLIGPGQVDDLGIIAVGLLLLVRLLVQFAPDDVVSEHVGRITGNRWSGPSSTFDGNETIDTSGRVRR